MGKPRPRTPRPGSSPLDPSTALTVPQRDPRTGKFAPGNTASRLRALKAGARHLIGLDPSKVAPWARGFVALANTDARRLVEEHGIVDDTALVRLAENAALANAVARGLAVLGLQGEGNRAALAEAKAWAQEFRQGLLTLKAESREHRKNRPAFPTIDDAEATRRLLAHRKAREQETVEEDPDEGEGAS
jgi:hypothetical protein